jgi:hypothetical protein
MWRRRVAEAGTGWPQTETVSSVPVAGLVLALVWESESERTSGKAGEAVPVTAAV